MCYSSLCHSVSGTGTDLAVGKHVLNEDINLCIPNDANNSEQQKDTGGESNVLFFYIVPRK